MRILVVDDDFAGRSMLSAILGAYVTKPITRAKIEVALQELGFDIG